MKPEYVPQSATPDLPQEKSEELNEFIEKLRQKLLIDQGFYDEDFNVFHADVRLSIKVGDKVVMISMRDVRIKPQLPPELDT